MKVNALIIDDLPLYADTITTVMQQRTDSLDDIEYHPTTFSGEGCFNQAKEYIFNNSNSIDLVFSDFNLGTGGNGIDLFNVFHELNCKPYRILHSNTDHSFIEHSEDYRDSYDAFCVSKETPHINKNLSIYENTIAKIKQYGNPNFHDFYYDRQNAFRQKKDAKIAMGSIAPLIDIMSYQTSDDHHTFTYRNFHNGRITASTRTISGRLYSQSALKDLTSELAFAHLNQSQSVNLLWVSKIDLDNQHVYFISPDSVIQSMKVFNFSQAQKYIESYDCYKTVLSKNLSSFFTS